MIQATKERLQFLVDNWERLSAREIADKLGVKIQIIYSWVMVMRKHGLMLTHKGGRLGILRTFVNDYFEKHPERRKDSTSRLRKQ